MTENDKETIINGNGQSLSEQDLPAVQATEKKPGLIRGAKELLESTFGSLKGHDINQAVEVFSSEMTLVAEGLSEDQAALRRDMDRAAADITLLEEDAIRRAQESDCDVRALREALAALDKRLEKLEKPPKAGKPRQGLAAVLRQATWMVGILSAAWVVVTLLKLLGG